MDETGTFKNIIEHRREHEILYTLGQTIKYLCEKLHLETELYPKACILIQKLAECECQCTETNIDSPQVQQVNTLLFSPQGISRLR